LRPLSRPRYLLAIAALAFLYSLAQAARHALRMRGGVDPVATPSGRLLDFVGDQASDCFQLLLCSYRACCLVVVVSLNKKSSDVLVSRSGRDSCSVKGKGEECE
jgi:hypothetical protein